MEQKKISKKLNNIEFLRFAFAVCIVYFHILHSAIIPYTGENSVYQYLAEQSKYTKYIVECFFMISGYFLYQSIQRHPDRTAGGFVFRRVIRLWPVLACSTILSVIFMKKSVCSGLINLCFLQSTSLATDWKGLNWYVSAFFFAEIFYFMLYKAMKNISGRRLFFCLLVYFGYSLNIMTTDGEFGRKVVYGVFSLALARAVAGVGLGCLVGEIFETIQNRKTDLKIFCKKRTMVLLISILEIMSLLLLVSDFFAGKTAPKNQFIVVILFCILFLCMLTRKGIFSRIVSCSRLCALGKYAYSIYVMQETAFLLMKKTVWKNTLFVQEHIFFCLILSIFAAVLLGIFTYHFVEKPAGKKILLLME